MYCREWVIYITHYSTADYLLIEKYIALAINKRRILTPKMLKHQIYFFFVQITQKNISPTTKHPQKSSIFKTGFCQSPAELFFSCVSWGVSLNTPYLSNLQSLEAWFYKNAPYSENYNSRPSSAHP
jgi:hypothetical protein